MILQVVYKIDKPLARLLGEKREREREHTSPVSGTTEGTSLWILQTLRS